MANFIRLKEYRGLVLCLDEIAIIGEITDLDKTDRGDWFYCFEVFMKSGVSYKITFGGDSFEKINSLRLALISILPGDMLEY